MKKKNMNKKGFTLIELLAVILILGIIALIAVPSINSVIKQANQEAAARSADEYIKAVETKFLDSVTEGKTLDDGLYTIEDLEEYNLDLEGDTPSEGELTIYDGEVLSGYLVFGDYIIEIDNGKKHVSKNGYKLKPGTFVYYNPVTGKSCTDYNENNTKTGVKTGCMRWNVVNDSLETSQVTLILDHSTSLGYAYEPDDERETSALEQLRIDTASWVSGLSPRFISFDEIKKNTNVYCMDMRDTEGEACVIGYNSFQILMDAHSSGDYEEYYNEIMYFGYEYIASVMRSYGDVLFECSDWGCEHDDHELYSVPNYGDKNYNFAYWTSTKYGNDMAYMIASDTFNVAATSDKSKAEYNDNGSEYHNLIGIRPVISVKKTVLDDNYAPLAGNAYYYYTENGKIISEFSYVDDFSGVSSYCINNQNSTYACEWDDIRRKQSGTITAFLDDDIDKDNLYVFVKDYSGRVSDGVKIVDRHDMQVQ